MERVRMTRPDGGTAWVVADRLEEYRRAGYRENRPEQGQAVPAPDTEPAPKRQHKTRKKEA